MARKRSLSDINKQAASGGAKRVANTIYPASSGRQGPGYDAVFEWNTAYGPAPKGYIPVSPPSYEGGAADERQKRLGGPNTPIDYLTPQANAAARRNSTAASRPATRRTTSTSARRPAAPRSTAAKAPAPVNVRYQQGAAGKAGSSRTTGTAGKAGTSTSGKAGSSSPGGASKGSAGAAGSSGSRGSAGTAGGKGTQGAKGGKGTIMVNGQPYTAR